jgi:FMN reductase
LLPVNAFRDKIVSMLVTAGTPKHYLIVEQQLKPILAYMKAQIVQSYVFIEEKDFQRKEIVNDDVLFRIERLVEDTIVLTETFTKIREEKEAKYAWNHSKDADKSAARIRKRGHYHAQSISAGTSKGRVFHY